MTFFRASSAGRDPRWDITHVVAYIIRGGGARTGSSITVVSLARVCTRRERVVAGSDEIPRTRYT